MCSQNQFMNAQKKKSWYQSISCLKREQCYYYSVTSNIKWTRCTFIQIVLWNYLDLQIWKYNGKVFWIGKSEELCWTYSG